MGKKVTGPVTLAEFARRVKVARPQITKAIASGRLEASVGRNSRGQPVIVDPGLAAKEWRENSKGQKGKGRTISLAEWQRRLTAEKTRAQKIANEIKLGALIEAAVAERLGFENARTIREAILNVPDRIAAELAAEASEAKVHARLDTELRLALEAVATQIAKKRRTG